ncbi:MAG: prohibitin family protein, partial [Holophagales bacterium]|nr:prohibitin family protein [Holophagales bacterium]
MSLLLGLLSLVALVQLWNRIFITIDPGHAGVLWLRFRGGTSFDRVLPEGTHIIFPWDKIFVYDRRYQEIQDQANFLTRDGLPLGASLSARFRPVVEELPRLHQEVGPDYIAKIIRPETLYGIRSVLGRYTPRQIYSSDLENIQRSILE